MGRPKGSKNKHARSEESTASPLITDNREYAKFMYEYRTKRAKYYQDILDMVTRINDPDIVETFDQLYERAKRMVDNP